MKYASLLFLAVFGFSVFAFAQVAPSATPAVVAAASAAAPAVVAAPAASGMPSAGFIGLVIGIVACLNVGLSAVQQMFGALSKSEPGWLQTVSSVVLSVSKYLGSNPNV